MNFIKDKNRRIALHILFWAAMVAVLGTIIYSAGAPSPNYPLERVLIMLAGQSFLIWLNIKYLVPLILHRRSLPFYIIIAFITVTSSAILLSILEVQLLPAISYINHPIQAGKSLIGRIFASKFFPYILGILIGTLGETLHFASQRTQEAIQLKSEKLETEMKFLKSQVNPHFLFNALNNVYTLAIIKADETPDVILRLSDMLRYMLYDCKADFVPLKKELDYIKNYIALYQLKEDKPFNLEIEMEKVNKNLMLPPMLFIPFIENSFKHSKIEDVEQSWIKMSLTTNGTLNFSIKNSIPKVEFTKDKVGGIGLENVKRRLELLYPNRYELEILNDGEVFEVKLVVDLNKS